MELLYVCLFILLAAFFNGSETAFISISRIKLHSRLELKDKRARILEKLLKNSENVIGTFIIGTSVFEVAIVVNFTKFLSGILGPSPLIPLYATLILTPVILIIATLIPKVIFREFADELMFPLASFYRVIYILLYPVQIIFVRIVKSILWVLGIKKKKSLYTKEDFNILLDMTADKGILKENEKKFIESIMNFKNIKAKEIMVPLIRMTCVEENDSVELASALMLTTRHSRIPVFRMRVDNMIGFVENKDLLDANKHDKIGKYVKEAVFVPDLMTINKVLVRMQNKMVQMAFVADEYGGVAGVITNQDIITEIIGGFVEIHENWIEKEGDAYLVNGMLNIDEINDELKLHIKKIDFETVAGFVLYKLGRIPEAGDSFDEGRFTFEVISATNIRVKRVKISPKKRKEKRKGINLNGKQPKKTIPK